MARVLGQVGISIDFNLRDRKEQMLLRGIAFSNAVQKIKAVLSPFHTDQVKPTLSFKGQFDPALLEYGFAKFLLAQATGEPIQIGPIP